METTFLEEFHNDDLGDDSHINNTIFKSLIFSSTTPLFGPSAWSKSSHLRITILFLTKTSILYIYQKRPSLQKGDDSGPIIRLMLCLHSSFPKLEVNDTFMLQMLQTCHVKITMKL
jgi:hypothetical protein